MVLVPRVQQWLLKRKCHMPGPEEGSKTQSIYCSYCFIVIKAEYVRPEGAEGVPQRSGVHNLGA